MFLRDSHIWNISMRHGVFSIIAVFLVSSALPLMAAPKKNTAPVKKDSGPEIVDYVAAVVNGNPITLSDVDERIDLYKKSRSGKKLTDRNSVLDQLINEVLVEQVAKEQSVYVTDTRIDNEISEMMKQANITDRADFVKKIETNQGIPFEMFRIQIYKQILLEQVMQYAIDFTPPSRQDAEEWYNKNRNAPDFVQMRYKQIVIRLRNDSFEEQKAASAKISEIQQRLTRGVPFEEIASRESQDPESARNGGDVGWVMLAQLAQTDSSAAGQLFQGYRPGGTGILRLSQGYALVRFIGKRVAPFSEVENNIYSMLAFQRKNESFNKWLDNQRENSELKIYLEGYVRTKKDGKSAGPVRR